MRILLTPGVYLPNQRAGSEIYLHKIAKYLLSIGHEVKCIAHCVESYEYEGVQVYKSNAEQWKNDNQIVWDWADLVFTQLSGTGYALNKSRLSPKKLINFAHNNAGYPQIPLRKNVFTVYNCQNTANELHYKHDSFTLPPPVFKEHYKDVDRSNAEYITLINHNENKGGKILIDIAKAMPDYKFMAVQGGYYKQIYSKEPNINYVPMVDDIRPYLAQTRILISPSEYESYGQAQVEAMCCGIPVIATNLPGFREALGDSGIYINDRNNVHEWVGSIIIVNNSMDGDLWPLSEMRANELDPKKDLADFANWLEKINNLVLNI